MKKIFSLFRNNRERGGATFVCILIRLGWKRLHELALECRLGMFARMQNCWGGGVTREKRPQQIIVSVTSYPARIGKLALILVPIFRQTVRPDRVILYLAEPQFPNREAALPGDLLALRKKGLEIRWCEEDLRSHKKYFYVMQEHPEDIVITIDDDIFYDRRLIEELWCAAEKRPGMVIAHRARTIKFSSENMLAPYVQWKLYMPETPNSSMSIIATSGGGTLFPPGCMHPELFNKAAFMELCPHADDLWLKIMQVMNHTPVFPIGNAKRQLLTLPEMQKGGLADYNYHTGNDIQIKNILARYNTFFGPEDTLLQRMRSKP